MKIALLSGAFVNAGDFLIEQRSKALLETNIPNAHVDVLKRNLCYDDKINMLNGYDMIVFGGGPGFQRRLYPKRMPFVSNLNAVTTPVAIMGWGWKGRSCEDAVIYRKRAFTSDMMRFVEHISKQTARISCRDWYTVRMLKEQGVKNTLMTGCPAWYRMDMIHHLKPKKSAFLDKINPTIGISDAAFPQNAKYMRALLQILRDMWPEAKMKVLLHHGITKYNQWLTDKKDRAAIQYDVYDISGGGGWSEYDTCDVHIGFRVHAHIYNLSMGSPSILINEDARGVGVNDALGLRDIFPGKYLREQLADYLDYLDVTDMRQYALACEAITYYYSLMQEYIKEISS